MPISDEQIRRMVEYLARVTLLIMPDRIRNLPEQERDQWVRETVRECLHVSRETGSEGNDARG